MIKSLTCIVCGQKTKIFIRRIRTKHNEDVLLLKNAPIYFCEKCHEVTIPYEVMMTFKFLKTLKLNRGVNEFDFQDVQQKIDPK